MIDMPHRRWALLAAIILAPIATLAQDRLKTMPGYEQYERMSREIPFAVKSGALPATWSDDGKSLEYMRGTVRPTDSTSRRNGSTGQVGWMGRVGQVGQEGGGWDGQENRRSRAAHTTATSPDGRLKAVYRDRNLFLTGADGSDETPITTDGSAAARVKYGTATWVYGEELEQRTAMWWSPDSRKIAYYRFDEKQVPDFYLTLNQTKLMTTLDTEAYPKAGAENPVVDLFVYDVVSKQSTKVDVRDGKPFDNAVVGHYVYRVQWTPDGSALLFSSARTAGRTSWRLPPPTRPPACAASSCAKSGRRAG